MKIVAIRGIMSSLEYYFTEIQFSEVPNIFREFFNEKEKKVEPFEKFQRDISRGKVRSIEKYLLENENFVLPPIVVSIEGKVEFEEIQFKLGYLNIEEGFWIINDGQHRVKAIYNIMNLFNLYKKDPKYLPTGYRKFIKNNYDKLFMLQYESLPMQVFVNFGLERNQQIFSDINRTPKRTSKSLNILFDNNDETAVKIKEFLRNNKRLLSIIEVEKSSSKNKAYTIVDLYGVAKLLEDDFEDFVNKLYNSFDFNLLEDKDKYIYPYSVFISALALAYKVDKSIFNRLDKELLLKEKMEGICIFDDKIKKDIKSIERLKNYLLNCFLLDKL